MVRYETSLPWGIFQLFFSFPPDDVAKHFQNLNLFRGETYPFKVLGKEPAPMPFREREPLCLNAESAVSRYSMILNAKHFDPE